jgi:hypothetical protein
VAFDLDIRVDKRNAHFSARMGMNGWCVTVESRYV